MTGLKRQGVKVFPNGFEKATDSGTPLRTRSCPSLTLADLSESIGLCRLLERKPFSSAPVEE